MLLEVAHTLEGWGEFYVIVGTSAGALAGLMFVVIALRAERASLRSIETFEAFGTPTLVQLGTVLLVSAIATVPHHSETSLSLCLVASGVAGLVYMVRVTQQVRKQDAYSQYVEDWLWRNIAPGLAFMALVLAGLVVSVDDAVALYVVGAATVAMMFIGIHNAWDSAVWIASDHPEET